MAAQSEHADLMHEVVHMEAPPFPDDGCEPQNRTPTSPASFRSAESSSTKETPLMDTVSTLLHTSLDNLLVAPQTAAAAPSNEALDLAAYLSTKQQQQEPACLPATGATPVTRHDGSQSTAGSKSPAPPPVPTAGTPAVGTCSHSPSPPGTVPNAPAGAGPNVSPTAVVACSQEPATVAGSSPAPAAARRTDAPEQLGEVSLLSEQPADPSTPTKPGVRGPAVGLDDLLVFTDEDLAALSGSGSGTPTETTQSAATPPPRGHDGRPTGTKAEQDDVNDVLDLTPPPPTGDEAAMSQFSRTDTDAAEKKPIPDNNGASQMHAVLSFFHSEPPRPLPVVATSPTVNAALFSSPPGRTTGSPDLRPAARVPEQQLEDVKKTTIYVVFQDQCTPVSWCSDTPIRDVREMVLCACDAMIDSGFVLREVVEVPIKENEGVMQTVVNGKELHYKYGRRYEFEELDQLMPGGTYTLQKATEREDLKRITGDRWRKLRVRIDPFLHVEAMKAIAVMRRGANLLKHTDLGFPHLRQFQLSSDCQRLLWYSSSDGNQQTSIQIKAVKEIRLGQQSPLFRAYKLPSLEHLSFSIFYESHNAFPKALATILPKLNPHVQLASLDITCKDEVEYDHWVCGLKALVFHANQLLISKEELLNHSRRFRLAVENSCPGFTLTTAPEPKVPGKGGLEDCLDLPVHSLSDLNKKLERLEGALMAGDRRIEQFDKQYNAQGELNRTAEDENPVTGSIPELASSSSTTRPPRGTCTDEDGLKREAQSSIFKDLPAAEDDRLEYYRMRELRVTVKDLMDEARGLLREASTLDSMTTAGDKAASPGLPKAAYLKKINQLLWKAEVDIENIDDMLSRLRERRESPDNAGLGTLLAKLGMNESFQRVGDQISSAFNALLHPPSSTAAS